MEKTDFKKILTADFDVKIKSTYRKQWEDGEQWSCFGFPKKSDHLCFLDGCNAEYTSGDGIVRTARDGDCVMTPSGSEYSIVFHPTRADGGTFGINFQITQNGLSVLFDRPLVLPVTDLHSMRKFCDRAEEYDFSGAIPVRQKANFMQILFLLHTEETETYHSKHTAVIRPCLNYLKTHPYAPVSIPRLAELCHVSEVYFRRVFKEVTGTSPNSFQIAKRMERAKVLLESGDLTVSEIAESLGYSDTAYFIRQFRSATGITPAAYKAKQ